MHEAMHQLSKTEMTLSQVQMERNALAQENKILKKKPDQNRNQPADSTSRSLSPTSPAPTPSSERELEPDFNENMRECYVEIERISNQKRSDLRF